MLTCFIVTHREVRRQTCDLVTLIEHAAPKSRYFMFMEDDFTTCLNGIRILHYALTKVNTVPELRNWVALRVSYGMNGVLLRTMDVLNFSTYLRCVTGGTCSWSNCASSCPA